MVNNFVCTVFIILKKVRVILIVGVWWAQHAQTVDVEALFKSFLELLAPFTPFGFVFRVFEL